MGKNKVSQQESKNCLQLISTFMTSNSMIMFTAVRTSCSRPCISKHMLLKTTSAPVAIEICLSKAVIVEGLRFAGGNSALNWTGNNQKEPT